MAITKSSKRRILAAKAKIKKKPFTLSPLQVLIIFSPVIIMTFFFLVAAALILGWRTLEWNETPPPQELSNKVYNSGRQYVIGRYGFATYTNKKYGFSIQYPKVGYIQDPECFKKGICGGKVIRDLCGMGITESKSGTPLITLDNMLSIFINSAPTTLDQYLVQRDRYITKQVYIESADAAVFVEKPNPVLSNGTSYLTSPAYYIKKGDKIFTIAPLQNFGSEKGCLPPAGTNANSFNSKYWNIPKSITFK